MDPALPTASSAAKTRSVIVRVNTDQLLEALRIYERNASSIDLNPPDYSSPVVVVIDGAQFMGFIDVVVKDRAGNPFTVVLEVTGMATKKRWFVELNRSKNGDTWHPKQQLITAEEDHELYVHSWTDH